MGNFVDKDGNVIGTHLGIASYTIGQKRGLGMEFIPPLSVIRINTDTSEILLGDDSELYDDYLIAKNPNFTHFDTLVDTFDITIKIYHWGYFLEATVCPADNNVIKSHSKNQFALSLLGKMLFYIWMMKLLVVQK